MAAAGLETNLKMVWRIPSYWDLYRSKKICSEPFANQSSGLVWQLGINPTDTYFIVYVFCSNASLFQDEEELLVTWMIELVNHNNIAESVIREGSMLVDRVHRSSISDPQCSCFMKWSDLTLKMNEFLHNGTLVINCRLKVGAVGSTSIAAPSTGDLKLELPMAPSNPPIGLGSFVAVKAPNDTVWFARLLGNVDFQNAANAVVEVWWLEAKKARRSEEAGPLQFALTKYSDRVSASIIYPKALTMLESQPGTYALPNQEQVMRDLAQFYSLG